MLVVIVSSRINADTFTQVMIGVLDNITLCDENHPPPPIIGPSLWCLFYSFFPKNMSSSGLQVYSFSVPNYSYDIRIIGSGD